MLQHLPVTATDRHLIWIIRVSKFLRTEKNENTSILMWNVHDHSTECQRQWLYNKIDQHLCEMCISYHDLSLALHNHSNDWQRQWCIKQDRRLILSKSSSSWGWWWWWVVGWGWWWWVVGWGWGGGGGGVGGRVGVGVGWWGVIRYLLYRYSKENHSPPNQTYRP